MTHRLVDFPARFDTKPTNRSGHEVIKLFSCSTHMSMHFQTLTNVIWLKSTKISMALEPSDVVLILLTNVDILTVYNMINAMLS